MKTLSTRKIPVTIDQAYEMCSRLAKRGWFVGQSSGGYLQGAYEVAKQIRNGTIVTIFNDLGERYFSTTVVGLNVKILPFRGLRYNPKKISRIGQVIAPPYDVIKDEQRIALEHQHANNVVRLILSQPYEKDTETDNQYTRSAATLRNWISERVLIRDAVAELLRLRSIIHDA